MFAVWPTSTTDLQSRRPCFPFRHSRLDVSAPLGSNHDMFQCCSLIACRKAFSATYTTCSGRNWLLDCRALHAQQPLLLPKSSARQVSLLRLQALFLKPHRQLRLPHSHLAGLAESPSLARPARQPPPRWPPLGLSCGRMGQRGLNFKWGPFGGHHLGGCPCPPATLEGVPY